MTASERSPFSPYASAEGPDVSSNQAVSLEGLSSDEIQLWLVRKDFFPALQCFDTEVLAQLEWPKRAWFVPGHDELADEFRVPKPRLGERYADFRRNGILRATRMRINDRGNWALVNSRDDARAWYALVWNHYRNRGSADGDYADLVAKTKRVLGESPIANAIHMPIRGEEAGEWEHHDLGGPVEPDVLGSRAAAVSDQEPVEGDGDIQITDGEERVDGAVVVQDGAGVAEEARKEVPVWTFEEVVDDTIRPKLIEFWERLQRFEAEHGSLTIDALGRERLFPGLLLRGNQLQLRAGSLGREGIIPSLAGEFREIKNNPLSHEIAIAFAACIHVESRQARGMSTEGKARKAREVLGEHPAAREFKLPEDQQLQGGVVFTAGRQQEESVGDEVVDRVDHGRLASDQQVVEGVASEIQEGDWDQGFVAKIEALTESLREQGKKLLTPRDVANLLVERHNIFRLNVDQIHEYILDGKLPFSLVPVHRGGRRLYGYTYDQVGAAAAIGLCIEVSPRDPYRAVPRSSVVKAHGEAVRRLGSHRLSAQLKGLENVELGQEVEDQANEAIITLAGNGDTISDLSEGEAPAASEEAESREVVETALQVTTAAEDKGDDTQAGRIPRGDVSPDINERVENAIARSEVAATPARPKTPEQLKAYLLAAFGRFDEERLANLSRLGSRESLQALASVMRNQAERDAELEIQDDQTHGNYAPTIMPEDFAQAVMLVHLFRERRLGSYDHLLRGVTNGQFVLALQSVNLFMMELQQARDFGHLFQGVAREAVKNLTAWNPNRQSTVR